MCSSASSPECPAFPRPRQPPSPQHTRRISTRRLERSCMSTGWGPAGILTPHGSQLLSFMAQLAERRADHQQSAGGSTIHCANNLLPPPSCSHVSPFHSMVQCAATKAVANHQCEMSVKEHRSAKGVASEGARSEHARASRQLGIESLPMSPCLQTDHADAGFCQLLDQCAAVPWHSLYAERHAGRAARERAPGMGAVGGDGVLVRPPG